MRSLPQNEGVDDTGRRESVLELENNAAAFKANGSVQSGLSGRATMRPEYSRSYWENRYKEEFKFDPVPERYHMEQLGANGDTMPGDRR